MPLGAAENQHRIAEDARIKRRALELIQWEKEQQEAQAQEARRRKLAVAAENARRKHEEEERMELQRQKAARLQSRKDLKRQETIKQLKQDKAILDSKLKKEQQQDEKLEIDVGIGIKDGHSTPNKKDPRNRNSNNNTSPLSQTGGSPMNEMPVAYSSLEAHNSPNGGQNAPLLSSTGKANPIVKDPFAKGERANERAMKCAKWSQTAAGLNLPYDGVMDDSVIRLFLPFF